MFSKIANPCLNKFLKYVRLLRSDAGRRNKEENCFTQKAQSQGDLSLWSSYLLEYSAGLYCDSECNFIFF